MDSIFALLQNVGPHAFAGDPARIFIAALAAFGALVLLISLVLAIAGRPRALPAVIIVLAFLFSGLIIAISIPQVRSIDQAANAIEKTAALLPKPVTTTAAGLTKTGEAAEFGRKMPGNPATAPTEAEPSEEISEEEPIEEEVDADEPSADDFLLPE